MNPHRDEANGDIQHAVVDRAATCITYGYWGEVRIGEATSAVPSVRSLQRTAHSRTATRSVPSHCTAPKSPSRTRMNLYLKRPHSSEPRIALARKGRVQPSLPPRAAPHQMAAQWTTQQHRSEHVTRQNEPLDVAGTAISAIAARAARATQRHLSTYRLVVMAG